MMKAMGLISSRLAVVGAVLLTASVAHAGQGNGNTVPICHYDGQGRVHLIHVNASAVPAHVANHGDHGLVTFYADADGDGYGDGATSVDDCAQPAGYVTDDTDCDDSDAAANPGAEEICDDGRDNNCDGVVDDGCPFPCEIGPAVKMLSDIPQRFDGTQGVCSEWTNVTVEVCREWPDQPVVVAQDAAGTSAGFFDEVGIIEVTSPTGAIGGVNFVFFQDQCVDPAYPQYYRPATTDITSLFGDETGYFTVDLRVMNAFRPYDWNETWIVRK